MRREDLKAVRTVMELRIEEEEEKVVEYD